MTRRELRTHIFRLLFETEFRDAEEMPSLIDIYLEDIESASFAEKAYISDKTGRILASVEELDEEINKVAKGWKTSRMNKVDLTILRLALYEIRNDDEVPASVAANEAVELAKQYSSDEASSFVNGIIASFIKSE